MTVTVTSYTMPVDTGDYNLLRSFCEDEGIRNIADRSACCFHLNAAVGILEGWNNKEQGFIMNELELEVFESVKKGGKVLAITGISPTLMEEFVEISQWLARHEKEMLDEEPFMGVIMSYDFDEEDRDLDAMTLKLKSYVGDTLAFVESNHQTMTIEDYGALLDGIVVYDEG